MSKAAIRFFDFLQAHRDNPRIVAHYDDFIKLAQAIYQAERCGFIIDADSVEEACERALEGML